MSLFQLQEKAFRAKGSSFILQCPRRSQYTRKNKRQLETHTRPQPLPPNWSFAPFTFFLLAFQKDLEISRGNLISKCVTTFFPNNLISAPRPHSPRNG